MRIKITAVFYVCLALTMLAPVVALCKNSNKDIEAVFLYNLTNYIFWAQGSKVENVFNICLVGDTGIEASFQGIQEKAKERDQILNVYEIEDNNYQFFEGSHCHIVYFSEKVLLKNQLDLDWFHQNNMLTVSTKENFSAKGAVELAFVQGKAKLIINMKKIKSAGLFVSSKLLRLARVLEE